MRVAGQVLENLFWPAEGTLGVYHPFHAAGLLTQCLEGRRVAQRFQLAMELEFALLERPSQMNQEPLAEVATEALPGRKNDFRYLRQGIHRELSGLIPPPGTTQWICG